ncbi:hypothetical protein T492DRAFT_850486, partial [Pavlovales sp. CCMP2436]
MPRTTASGEASPECENWRARTPAGAPTAPPAARARDGRANQAAHAMAPEHVSRALLNAVHGGLGAGALGVAQDQPMVLRCGAAAASTAAASGRAGERASEGREGAGAEPPQADARVQDGRGGSSDSDGPSVAGRLARRTNGRMDPSRAEHAAETEHTQRPQLEDTAADEAAALPSRVTRGRSRADAREAAAAPVRGAAGKAGAQAGADADAAEDGDVAMEEVVEAEPVAVKRTIVKKVAAVVGGAAAAVDWGAETDEDVEEEEEGKEAAVGGKAEGGKEEGGKEEGGKGAAEEDRSNETEIILEGGDSESESESESDAGLQVRTRKWREEWVRVVGKSASDSVRSEMNGLRALVGPAQPQGGEGDSDPARAQHLARTARALSAPLPPLSELVAMWETHAPPPGPGMGEAAGAKQERVSARAAVSALVLRCAAEAQQPPPPQPPQQPPQPEAAGRAAAVRRPFSAARTTGAQQVRGAGTVGALARSHAGRTAAAAVAAALSASPAAAAPAAAAAIVAAAAAAAGAAAVVAPAVAEAAATTAAAGPGTAPVAVAAAIVVVQPPQAPGSRAPAGSLPDSELLVARLPLPLSLPALPSQQQARQPQQQPQQPQEREEPQSQEEEQQPQEEESAQLPLDEEEEEPQRLAYWPWACRPPPARARYDPDDDAALEAELNELRVLAGLIPAPAARATGLSAAGPSRKRAAPPVGRSVRQPSGYDEEDEDAAFAPTQILPGSPEPQRGSGRGGSPWLAERLDARAQARGAAAAGYRVALPAARSHADSGSAARMPPPAARAPLPAAARLPPPAAARASSPSARLPSAAAARTPVQPRPRSCAPVNNGSRTLGSTHGPLRSTHGPLRSTHGPLGGSNGLGSVRAGDGPTRARLREPAASPVRRVRARAAGEEEAEEEGMLLAIDSQAHSNRRSPGALDAADRESELDALRALAFAGPSRGARALAAGARVPAVGARVPVTGARAPAAGANM